MYVAWAGSSVRPKLAKPERKIETCVPRMDGTQIKIDPQGRPGQAERAGVGYSRRRIVRYAKELGLD